MANCNCVVRTNYFKVKDNKAFEDFMETVFGDEEIEILTMNGKNGDALYGFGSYGSINGATDEDGEETSYDEFIQLLQEHIAEDDAALIFNINNENLNYVGGYVEVITNNEYKFENLMTIGKSIARDILGNDKYDTRCDY